MHLPAILPWGAADGFSKQMLLVILSVVIIATFFLLAARKQQLVPGKLQFAGETAYGFVRNSIAKDIIGGRDFMKYVPLLFTPVLLHPGEQHLRRNPADPASELLARRRRLRARGHRVHHLDRHRRQEERPEVLQAGHRSVRSPVLHPPDRRSDRDHLQLPGPPGHAQPPSVRHHAGRPPDRHDRRFGHRVPGHAGEHPPQGHLGPASSAAPSPCTCWKR